MITVWKAHEGKCAFLLRHSVESLINCFSIGSFALFKRVVCFRLRMEGNETEFLGQNYRKAFDVKFLMLFLFTCQFSLWSFQFPSRETYPITLLSLGGTGLGVDHPNCMILGFAGDSTNCMCVSTERISSLLVSFYRNICHFTYFLTGSGVSLSSSDCGVALELLDAARAVLDLDWASVSLPSTSTSTSSSTSGKRSTDNGPSKLIWRDNQITVCRHRK